MATAPGPSPLGLPPGVRRRAFRPGAPPARARRGARRPTAPARAAPAPAQGVAGRSGAPLARLLRRRRGRPAPVGLERGRRQGVGPRRRLPAAGVAAAVGRRGGRAVQGVAEDGPGTLPRDGPRPWSRVERPRGRADHGVERGSRPRGWGVSRLGGTPWPGVRIGCLSLR
jgi:hypothetical protein